jgi:hypothetical protein
MNGSWSSAVAQDQDRGPAAQTSGGSVSPQASDYQGLPGHIRPQMYQRQQRRSIVHHYAYPYPGYYQDDETAGFRNPGNIGRHAEYYLPGDQFQNPGDHMRVAQFGQGGYPSREEQLEAQRVGIARYNSIQGHIDNYARPYWGYGFGVGRFGGFW